MLAPVIDTSRFTRSHRKPPRGRALWLFENDAGDVVFAFTGLYSAARTAARAWAAERGALVLYVCP